LVKRFESSSDNRLRIVHVFWRHLSGGALEETGRSWARTSRHYLYALLGEFVANGFTEVEDEGFCCSVGRHVGDRLKAGVRGNIDNATLASGSHCFAEEMRESDQRLYIHLNFSLLLLGIMGEKCTVQTESRIIDE
jgi:hypothetical protein